MELRRVVCAVVLMTSVATTAVAQEKKKEGAPPDPQAMMAAYDKAAEPVEQHKLLQKMVGKWNVTMKSWMDPKAPPMESTGTAEVKPLLGDRYTQMNFTATMMGKPFNGINTSGYDKTKKKFVSTWIDTMSTGMMRSEGTANASGKIITANAVGTDALTGKETKMKIVSNYEADDKAVEEFFEKKGGKETKVMEITYTRAK